MDYSSMAPGGLIPQLGGTNPVLPSDIDFGMQPAVYSTDTLGYTGQPTSVYSEGYPYTSTAYPQTDTAQSDAYSGAQTEAYASTDAENYNAYAEDGTYGEAAVGEEYQQMAEEDGAEEVGIGSIKKAKDGSEWLITHWCDICRVGLVSQRQLEMHNAGKNHLKKERMMNENSAAYYEFLRMKDGGARSSWTCEVCNLTLPDADQYQDHLRGRPHEKNLRLRSGNRKVFDYFCDLCNVSTGNNRVVYDAHIEGNKHQKRLFNGKMDLTLVDPAEAAYYCDTCKIHMDNASQYISHLSGQQHLRRLRGEGEEIGEVGSSSGLLASSTGNSKTYWCDVCKVTMTGRQPWEAHLNGNKHKTKMAAQTPGERQQQQRQQQQQKTGQKRGFPDYETGPSDEASAPPRPSPTPMGKDEVIDKKCDICHVTIKTQSGWDAHVQGQMHVKKQKMLDSYGGRLVIAEGSLTRKILDMGPVIKDKVIWCPICEKKFVTLAAAQDHFPARQHRGKMRILQMEFEKQNAEHPGWVTGVSTLTSSSEDTAAVPVDAAASYGGSFVAGGIIESVLNTGIMDKAAIDAGIREARAAVTGEDVDAHVKAFEQAKNAQGAAEDTTDGNADGNADEMDVSVKEVSPHDTSAIVCDICNVGVTTTQMLECHVVGSKHLRTLIGIAINDGTDISGIHGPGVPNNQRGRGRGWGNMSRGVGGRGLRGRGRGFGGRGGWRGGGFRGYRGWGRGRGGMAHGPPTGMDHGPPTGMDHGPPAGMDQGPPTGMDHGPPVGYEPPQEPQQPASGI